MKIFIGEDHPDDGNYWECQCARCGSSIDFVECDYCEDGYSHHDCGEDCCCCEWPENNVLCDVCGGNGGWLVCLSGHEWCNAYPKEGREKIESGKPEWFCVEMKEREQRDEFDNTGTG